LIKKKLSKISFRVLTLSQVLEYLVKNGKITEEVSKNVQAFIRQNQTQLTPLKIEIENKPITIPIRQRFQTIIKEKKTNLCLSADLTSLDEIIEVKLFREKKRFFLNKILLILVI